MKSKTLFWVTVAVIVGIIGGVILNNQTKISSPTVNPTLRSAGP